MDMRKRKKTVNKDIALVFEKVPVTRTFIY